MQCSLCGKTKDRNPELSHMGDGLGYLLTSHEENDGPNKVVIMREKEIAENVALHQEHGYFVSPRQER